MFLQVDTSFTFCLVAIKNPLLMLQPSTPMPPAALLTSSHPAAWHLPSVILGNKQWFSHFSSCPLSPKKPKQEDGKIQVSGSSNHTRLSQIAWAPLRNISGALTLMVKPWASTLFFSRIPTAASTLRKGHFPAEWRMQQLQRAKHALAVCGSWEKLAWGFGLGVSLVHIFALPVPCPSKMVLHA